MTYGSDDTYRAFARINLGSPVGLRSFVSYSFNSTDKYKGEGMRASTWSTPKVGCRSAPPRPNDRAASRVSAEGAEPRDFRAAPIARCGRPVTVLSSMSSMTQ